MLIGKGISDVFEELAFPEFFVVLHQSSKKFKKGLSDIQALEFRMLDFHHFEHVGIFRVLEVFFHFIGLINFELLKSLKKLFMKFFR